MLPLALKPEPMLPLALKPEPMLPLALKPEPMLPSLLKPEPMLPSLLKPEPMLPSLLKPEPMLPSLLKPEPMLPSFLKPEPMLPFAAAVVPAETAGKLESTTSDAFAAIAAHIAMEAIAANRTRLTFLITFPSTLRPRSLLAAGRDGDLAVRICLYVM
jgi:hypothetical protein